MRLGTFCFVISVRNLNPAEARVHYRGEQCGRETPARSVSPHSVLSVCLLFPPPLPLVLPYFRLVFLPFLSSLLSYHRAFDPPSRDRAVRGFGRGEGEEAGGRVHDMSMIETYCALALCIIDLGR